MNLSAKFSELQNRGEKALVLFITAGDPSLEALPEISEALQEAGADILEIGLPFTDPIADGPVIQASSQRALDRGVRPRHVLAKIAECNFQVPVVLMGYYNPALRWGLSEFAAECKSAGASGTIMCDVIPEEAGDWISASKQAGLDTVFLAAPTSTPERQKVVCESSSGFVYAVSRTGVTGAGESAAASSEELVSQLRKYTSTPICVGFGISQPDQVREVCQYADGAIIGSWLVNELASHWEDSAARKTLLSQIRELKGATKS
ncbi:MAG: tryptophan synthase subunit alpha [Fimbriimonadaceae bacterium]|nr:MAG: tryptophan synthase subunit alpha [Fimbriimonadaceae bacterium]